MDVRLIVLSLALLATSVMARDPAQVRKFRSDHPCPATHSTKGACPGWVVDHVIPLCLGGVDEPRNMQWQDHATSLLKDKLEWEACRKAHKAC